VYDQGVDEYGVQSGIVNVMMTDTLITDVFMKLAKEDLTGPMLVKANPLDKNHLVAEFSKPIQQESITTTSFTIIDTLDQKPLGVISAFLSPSSLNSFMAITNDQDSTKMYRIVVQGIKDSIGNSIQTNANSLVFQGSPKIDTLRPRLTSISIKDSIQEIEIQPKITFIFSDALARTTSLGFINLFNNKNQEIPLKKKWMSDVLIAIEPEKELSSLTWYTLRADLQNVRDWAGRTFKDSVRSWRFETLDVEDLASIDGIISDSGKAHSEDRLYVTAIQTEERGKRYMTTVDTSSKFIFPQVTGGLYLLQAFGDRNSNGIYDEGRPFPFSYSERLSRPTDTLKVRPRWMLEGVNIQMH
jgi:hypothetical protein